jgi:hypothetical protein
MNMGKIRRRAFVLCLLALLFPLAANAVPKIELTAYLYSVDRLKDDGIIQIYMVGYEPWNVRIGKYTEVGFDLKRAKPDEGVLIRVKGVYAKAEGGILALEVDEGVLGESKFEGTITKTNDDPSITIIGHDIPLPDGVELKDKDGGTIKIEDLDDELAGMSVKVEGYTGGDDYYFHVSAVKEIIAFYCANSAKHEFDVSELESTDTEIVKVRTDYCQSLKDPTKRHGITEISEFIYPINSTDTPNPGDALLSNYTFGKWKDGKRHGYWLTIDVAGKLLRWCRYDKNNLKERDSEGNCPA